MVTVPGGAEHLHLAALNPRTQGVLQVKGPEELHDALFHGVVGALAEITAATFLGDGHHTQRQAGEALDRQTARPDPVPPTEAR